MTLGAHLVTRLAAGARMPPAAVLAELGGGERDKRAEAEAEARRHREHMAATLSLCEVAEARRYGGADDGLGAVAVDAVALPSGEVVVIPGARVIREDWEADPQALGRAFDRCGKAWGVHHAEGGGAGAHALGCGSQLCPVCARKRARERCERWAPVLGELAADGYQLAHWTFTQPARADHAEDALPVVNGFGRGPQGLAGLSSYGETLGDAVDRLRASLDALRYNRRHRDWWNRHVAGFVWGIEWTARAKSGRRRWHVHGHALLVLRNVERAELGGRPDLWRDGRELAGPWRDELTRRWCSVAAGAMPAGQMLTAVDDHAEVLREVLKYPCKPASLSPAQLCEALSTMKGRQVHSPGGALHAASRTGRRARALLAGGATYNRRRRALAPFDERLAHSVARGLRKRQEGPRHGIGMRLRRLLPGKPRHGHMPDGDGQVWEPVFVRDLAQLVEDGEDAMRYAVYWPHLGAMVEDAQRRKPAELLAELVVLPSPDG